MPFITETKEEPHIETEVTYKTVVKHLVKCDNCGKTQDTHSERQNASALPIDWRMVYGPFYSTTPKTFCDFCVVHMREALKKRQTHGVL